MRINRDVLSTELARKCMTWKDLSEKSGINTVTLARINNGSQEPMPRTVGRLALALGVSIEALTVKADQY